MPKHIYSKPYWLRIDMFTVSVAIMDNNGKHSRQLKFAIDYFS